MSLKSNHVSVDIAANKKDWEDYTLLSLLLCHIVHLENFSNVVSYSPPTFSAISRHHSKSLI